MGHEGKIRFRFSGSRGNIPVESMSERDGLLIAEFNAQRSEAAFAALVRQHIGLVFATALRQVGDAGAAEEITQNVFVVLAQAAGKLESHPTIAGWLHQTALNKSREWLREELRRRRREQVAVNLELAGKEGDSVWTPLVPLLDEALLELRERDRAAVILHFMEGQTFHEVGSTLGVGEDAARKRVNRCLDQLTNFFRRRGFAVPAVAAGAPLFTLSSHAAPAGLAASATTAGLAAAHSAASTSTLTLIKGALKIMAWTKAKTAVVAGAILILAAGTTTVIVKNSGHQSQAKSPLPPEAEESFQRESIVRMNQSKQWALASILYANDRQNQLPDNFQQLKTYLPKAGLSDSNWEIVSGGNLNSFVNSSQNSRIILLREKAARQSPDGKYVKAYAFVDGHVEMISSPDDDFAALEKQRGFLIQPAKN